jgi:hypothetical protein
MQVQIMTNNDIKLFIFISLLAFTVFLFFSDGHRYTFDEDVIQQQSQRIALMETPSNFISGESRINYEFPEYFPNNNSDICYNGILCSLTPIGSSLIQVPFILINENLQIISETIIYTSEDFDDPHYVWWRNSLEPNFIFVDLVTGPFYASLLVGIFFLTARTFYHPKTSLFLALLFGFSTPIWAYSQTSLNVIPAAFFILLGFLFFRKFQINHSSKMLIFCSSCLGFGFLIRFDVVLIIIPLFFFMLYNLLKRKHTFKLFFAFVIPSVMSYVILRLINVVKFGNIPTANPMAPATSIISGAQTFSFLDHIFGLLFSPGLGLFVFSPILFTVFLSFYDFYHKNKSECILFGCFIGSFLLFFSTTEVWHGLNSWASRYLIMIIPFLILPLGMTIEKRSNIFLKSTLIFLGIIGVFINLVYLIQDVSWFVWGSDPLSTTGLYALHQSKIHYWFHPLTLWTFEFSQLTHSIKLATTSLQPDIFLLKILGLQNYLIVIMSLISIPIFFIIKILKQSK